MLQLEKHGDPRASDVPQDLVIIFLHKKLHVIDLEVIFNGFVKIQISDHISCMLYKWDYAYIYGGTYCTPFPGYEF